jgi:hypothetical protein
MTHEAQWQRYPPRGQELPALGKSSEGSWCGVGGGGGGGERVCVRPHEADLDRSVGEAAKGEREPDSRDVNDAGVAARFAQGPRATGSGGL